MSEVWIAVGIGAAVHILTAAVLYGRLVQRVSDHGERIEKLEDKSNNHGERIATLEARTH